MSNVSGYQLDRERFRDGTEILYFIPAQKSEIYGRKLTGCYEMVTVGCFSILLGGNANRAVRLVSAVVGVSSGFKALCAYDGK